MTAFKWLIMAPVNVQCPLKVALLHMSVYVYRDANAKWEIISDRYYENCSVGLKCFTAAPHSLALKSM